MILYGRLVGPDGWSLRLDDRDVHWCAVSLFGEAGTDAWEHDDGLAILWTYAQRMWTLRDKSVRRKDGLVLKPPYSLADYVRAYSQPVNPYWLTHGSAERQPRRRYFQTMPTSEIPTPLLDLVQRWALGRVAPASKYAGAVHFIATEDAEDAPSGAVPFDIPGTSPRNTFFSMGESRAWRRVPVAVVPPSGSDYLSMTTVSAIVRT